MPQRAEPEPPSLKWIYRIREQQYRKTKGLPVQLWQGGWVHRSFLSRRDWCYHP